MADRIDFIDSIRSSLPAQATAGTAQSTVACVTPVSGIVSSVKVTLPAAIVGSDTANRKFALVNKGPAGAGSTEIASFITNVAGAPAAFIPKALALSAVANATRVSAGDVLAVVETTTGAGVASPGGCVEIVLAR